MVVVVAVNSEEVVAVPVAVNSEEVHGGVCIVKIIVLMTSTNIASHRNAVSTSTN